MRQVVAVDLACHGSDSRSVRFTFRRPVRVAGDALKHSYPELGEHGGCVRIPAQGAVFRHPRAHMPCFIFVLVVLWFLAQGPPVCRYPYARYALGLPFLSGAVWRRSGAETVGRAPSSAPSWSLGVFSCRSGRVLLRPVGRQPEVSGYCLLELFELWGLGESGT